MKTKKGEINIAAVIFLGLVLIIFMGGGILIYKESQFSHNECLKNIAKQVCLENNATLKLISWDLGGNEIFCISNNRDVDLLKYKLYDGEVESCT